MQNISPAWLYLLIITAGLLQAWGPPMNGALQKSLVNMSVASDKYGWFGVGPHALTPGRLVGCALLVIGIILISKF